MRENSAVCTVRQDSQGMWGESVGDGVPEIVGAEAGYGRARIGVKSHVPGLGLGVKRNERKESLMEHD